MRRLLVERLTAGIASLHDLTPAERLHRVVIDPRAATNVNTPADLRGAELPVELQ